MIRTFYSTGFDQGAERRPAREAELAEWIARRYSELYPNRPALAQVRFLQVQITPDPEDFTKGRWHTPRLSEFSDDHIKEVSVHNVDD
jgi:hypothetical protein